MRPFLGLLVLVSAIGLLFIGYSKKSDDSWTMTTPEGYAAPVPLDKGSWKDNLPEIVKSEEPVLETPPAKPAKVAKKAAKKKPKRLAKGRKNRRHRPSIARR